MHGNGRWMTERNSRFSRRKVLKSAGIASGSSLVVGSASAGPDQRNKQTGKGDHPGKKISESIKPESVPPKPKKPKNIKQFDPHNPHHVVYVAEKYSSSSKREKKAIENKLSKKQKQAIVDAQKPVFTVVKSYSNESGEQLSRSETVDEIKEADVHSSERKVINESVIDKWGWYDEL